MKGGNEEGKRDIYIVHLKACNINAIMAITKLQFMTLR